MAIFKYFTDEAHALALIGKGELMLQPLSHFRTHEDEGVRGDRHDGALIYAHDKLVMDMEDGREIPAHSFISTVRQTDIYVYCASQKLSAERAEEFGRFCVEIDPVVLVRRLRRRAHPTSQFDYERTVSGAVDYRPLERAPGVEWALPEKLVLMKPEAFARQAEFRIAIGKRNAFDVENVGLTVQVAPPQVAEATISAFGPIFLRVGKLDDIAKLHRF